VTVSVQLLMSPGCGNGEKALALLRELLASLAPGASLETVLVTSNEEAARLRFPGSPTVRVDGRDIDPSPPDGTGLG
jgi:hypothetical protein